MDIKDLFLVRGKFQIQADQARFWENWWIGLAPLMQKYPSIALPEERTKERLMFLEQDH